MQYAAVTALVAQRIEHLTTDQKVGGSSPSERAQVRGPLPDSEGAFLIFLGATLEPPARISHEAAAYPLPTPRCV